MLIPKQMALRIGRTTISRDISTSSIRTAATKRRAQQDDIHRPSLSGSSVGHLFSEINAMRPGMENLRVRSDGMSEDQRTYARRTATWLMGVPVFLGTLIQLLNPVTQPPAASFKTNVNRSKTRKWAEAKNYSYDGDDWGGYDPYDEYGSYDDKQDPPLPAASPRRNSFEAGEEVTAFSSGQQQQQQSPPPPPAHITPTKPQPLQPASQPQNDYGIRRDFSQIAHIPPPLKTNTSPQVVRERFPARKSSLQTSLPSSPAQPAQQFVAQEPVSPSADASAAANAGKPLPFIRPADIYRRMEEERLREQESKGQIESVPVRHEEHQGFTVESPILAKAIGADVAGTEPAPQEQSKTASLGSALPAVSRVASGFGSEFWNASELSSSLNTADNLSPTTTNTAPVEPAETNSVENASHELQDAVSQAFERRDDLSVPPTPISRDNSQSGHGSDTAGISPIMSRVPSAATAEAKARLADNRDMGPIAEESSLPGSPSSRPSSQQQTVTKRHTPTHSRHVSAESFSNSPARTPQLEYTKRLSTPMSAESTSMQAEEAGSPVDPPSKPMPVASVRVIAPSADYSRRESDIAADATSSSPIETAEAANAARTHFLQTHERVKSPVIGSPVDRSPSPISRQGSPGPGRVRDLAGKYNELHTLSRSSSAMSFGSQKSDKMSLSRSGTFDSTTSETGDMTGDDKVIQSIEQTPSTRPDPTRGPSFRPHLPGEWVSYVGTPSMEMPVAQEATRRSDENARDDAQLDQSTPRQAMFPSTEDFDPTPATVKQPLAHKDIQPKEPSPVDTLKNAGEALGAALLSSFGQNHGTRDFAQAEPQSPEEDAAEPRPSVGDVYLRPLMVDRKASSIASSVGPTPPAKDTPDGLSVPGSSGYFPPPTLRIDSDAMSPASDYSPADLESDRLRREIERSLTPQLHSEHQRIRDQDALDAPATLRDLQKTEGLQTAEAQPRSDVHAIDAAPTALQPTPAAKADLLGKRFSFERDASKSSLWGEVGEDVKRASYERPLSGVGLHVVNTNVSSSSESSASSVREIPAEAVEEFANAPLQTVISSPSPVASSDIIAAPTVGPPVATEESREEQPLPAIPMETETPLAPSTTTNTTTAARIPTVREIMALKSVDERVNTYNSSREQIASMDTGLSNWLSSTLSSHPEHAHVVKDAANKPATTTAIGGSIRYKPQPGNIMKMARKGLSGVTNREPSGSHAADPSQTSSTIERQTSNTPGRTASAQHGGVEKMQTKGKDLLHSAGMFGGKATVGAKGLFARAKGRLREGGSEKASGRATPSSNAVLASPTSPDERGSKANNRFSTAFGRLGSLSQSNAGAPQPPNGGPQVVVSPTVGQPSASPSGNGDAYIAPWMDDKAGALDKDLVNERFKRIGLLPSPAFGGSMTSRDSNENIKATRENDDQMSQLEGATHSDELSKKLDNEALKAATADVLAKPAAPSHVEETVPEPQADLPAPALGANNAGPLSGPSEITSEHPRPVERTSNINSSPTRRPVPQQTITDEQPSSRRSSVSSFHPDDNDLAETSIPLKRSVSPLGVESTSQLPITFEKTEPEKTKEDTDEPRPRIVSRSSLPSQQRPQSQSRQSSWQWKSSGTSLVGLNQSQGDATASPVKSRSVSGQPISSGPVSRAESPISFLEMAPTQKQRRCTTPGAYSSENVDAIPGARVEQPLTTGPQNLTLAPAPYEVGRMAPIVQSPVEMQGPWHNDQSNATMGPGPGFGPGAMYNQPGTMSSEQIIYEEPVNRTFSPTVMDPRQHDSEYQLPGVGPPEVTQGSRRSRFFMRSPVQSPVQVERINPNAVAFDHQRTFSGDEVPLTQSAQEKREKRRSGMFSALSRGSSFSGLSVMNSDGRQSRGNDVAQAGSQQQASAQQTSAAQKAREISGGSTRGNTLKKMQRSSTSAGTSNTPGTPDAEKKNKRFSRLGSIFGRSNSEAKKANKLVKSMPKTQTDRVPEAAVAARANNMSPQNIPPPPPMAMGYGVDNGMQSQQHWSDQLDQQSGAPPPPGGWYAPTSRRSSYHQDQQATLPQIQPTMSRRSSYQQDQQVNLSQIQPTVSGQSWQSMPPQQQQSPVMQPTRRLHSEGYRHEPRYNAPADYRSMSPSPLRGQRGSQQYDTTTPQNYQRTPSWTGGPRQQPPPGRNLPWASADQQQQQQQGYFPQTTMSGSPVRQSPAHSPSHSRNASFGSMTNIQAAAPPLYRNPSSGALQRSSSPSMYGATQPYQVPMPAATEAQLMSKTQQDWYPRYAIGSPGPPQQASTPGMYTRSYSNSRPGSSNANYGGFDDIPEAEYARPGSAGGMMMPPPPLPQLHSPQSPARGQQRRYYGNGGTMGPRPYPGQQQGDWQGSYRDV
ncbi:hypothetical protein E4T52_03743 [Aureobasidium sp. EXF-3400]|nr:hypothetical protein E4T52_03743 [Aureobasidium sp. EXF-3400]